MDCPGNGSCLYQTTSIHYRINPECAHYCRPHHCNDCYALMPKWVKDHNNGHCVNCATRIYCENKKRNT